MLGTRNRVRKAKERMNSEEEYLEKIRAVGDDAKKFFDNYAKILEYHMKERRVWATAFMLIKEQYGDNFPVNTSKLDLERPFVVTVHAYPEEEGLWRVRINVDYEEKEDDKPSE